MEPATKPKKTASMSELITWVAVAVGILAILNTVLTTFTGRGINQYLSTATPAKPDATPTLRPSNASDAWLDCKSFVTKTLKAPSTAQFPLLGDQGVSSAYLDPIARWSVIGYVDAQNSLGVSLRQHFLCQVAYEGDKVSLRKLTIEGQTLIDR